MQRVPDFPLGWIAGMLKQLRHPLAAFHAWQWRDVRSGKLTYGQEMVRRESSPWWRVRYWIADKLVRLAELTGDTDYEET